MADTLICSIELSKTAGLTVTVQNDSDNIKQTIVMDGSVLTVTVEGQTSTSKITQTTGRIIHEVKGPAQTSTMTQIQDKISFEVKVLEQPFQGHQPCRSI